MLPSDHGTPAALTQEVGQPLVEAIWVEPYPDEALELRNGYAAPEARYEQREAVELAFIAAVQHLPATQRAVLILREVLGFSAREVSASLDTTVARRTAPCSAPAGRLAERLPERSQQETLRSLGDERVKALVEAFVDAWSRGDVEALQALLAEDAVFSMPPWPMWWRGGETIARFAAAAVGVCAETRSVASQAANGQPTIANYSLDPETGRFVASALDVLTLEGSRIKAITAFVMPELFPRFGLAPVLGPEPDTS